MGGWGWGEGEGEGKGEGEGEGWRPPDARAAHAVANQERAGAHARAPDEDAPLRRRASASRAAWGGQNREI